MKLAVAEVSVPGEPEVTSTEPERHVARTVLHVQRPVMAAAIEPTLEGTVSVPALEAIEPIELSAVEPDSIQMSQIAIEPIQVAPLRVEPLPSTPQ